MIGLVIGSAVYLVAMQASVNVPRAAFSDCLKQAGVKATSSKIEPEAYGDFIRGQCTAQTATFKEALVSFDVKNGIKRSQAASDADLQIDDYIISSTENYSARFVASKPKTPAPAAAAAAPAPTPASSPQ